MTLEKAIEKVFNQCNIYGDDADIYGAMMKYKAIRQQDHEQQEKIYNAIAERLGFMED